MPIKQVAPYGSWQSQLSADAVARTAVRAETFLVATERLLGRNREPPNRRATSPMAVRAPVIKTLGRPWKHRSCWLLKRRESEP